MKTGHPTKYPARMTGGGLCQHHARATRSRILPAPDAAWLPAPSTGSPAGPSTRQIHASGGNDGSCTVGCKGHAPATGGGRHRPCPDERSAVPLARPGAREGPAFGPRWGRSEAPIRGKWNAGPTGLPASIRPNPDPPNPGASRRTAHCKRPERKRSPLRAPRQTGEKKAEPELRLRGVETTIVDYGCGVYRTSTLRVALWSKLPP